MENGEKELRIFTPQKTQRTLILAPKLLNSVKLSENCVMDDDVDMYSSNVKCKAHCMMRTTPVKPSNNNIRNSNSTLRAFDSEHSSCNDAKLQSSGSETSQISGGLSVNIENETEHREC